MTDIKTKVTGHPLPKGATIIVSLDPKKTNALIEVHFDEEFVLVKKSEHQAALDALRLARLDLISCQDRFTNEKFAINWKDASDDLTGTLAAIDAVLGESK